jgi:predicted glycoside hydrolase/deacetylase ChbG (UPF0249 family)
VSGRYVIFNADDFGYSHGINRGILEGHEGGVVTSATLVVNGMAAAEAARLARARPALAVGLHVNFTNEADRLLDLEDREACRTELRGQYARFCDLMGGKPTHLDSHQHVHRHHMRRRLFEELADEEGLPLRDRPPVVFKGGFYGQWTYGVFEPEKVSFEALARILRHEIADGVYEMSCHPGYFDPALAAVYHRDREAELKTLTDRRLRPLLDELGIALISYRELGRATGREAEGAAAAESPAMEASAGG